MIGDLGIVVVTYNSAEFLAPCLASALARSTNVVVVDNASSDGCVAIARRQAGVQVLANTENRGFAAAVNQGVRALAGEFVLLLNPDARLVSPLDAMLARAAQAGVGAVGGRLLEEDGRDQTGFAIRRFPTPASLIFENLGINRLWPNNPVNRRYRALDANLAESQPAEQPAGAFLLFSRAAWNAVGGFDERFAPVWFEDVDFLRRLDRAGFAIWYEPEARAVHAGGHSVKELQPSRRQRFWYGNLLKYAAGHFQSGFTVRLVAASVLVGLGVRRLLTGQSAGGGVASLAWRYVARGRAAGIANGDTGKKA